MAKFLFPPGHKYSVGNKGGAPAKYKTVEELEDRIAKWKVWLLGERGVRPKMVFDSHTGTYVRATEKVEVEFEGVTTPKRAELFEEYWIEEPQKPSIANFVLFLGFSSRQSLLDYRKAQGKTSKFSDTLQAGIEWIGKQHQENLLESGAAGSQFWLKNHGWKDQTSVEVDSTNETKRTTMTFEEAMFAKYGKDWKKITGYDDGSTEDIAD